MASKRTKDAVAAKLKRAQKGSDDANPKGFSDKRRARQNARVAKRIEPDK